MPHRQERILILLSESLSATAEDLDALRADLMRVLAGEPADDSQDELTLSQIAALGFLALVKAQRETGLMLEVAVREEIQEIATLTDAVHGAVRENGAVVSKIVEDLTPSVARLATERGEQ